MSVSIRERSAKFYQLLIERLKKFGLEIAEDKSRILPFGRYKGTKESFDFLDLHITMRKVIGANTVYCIERVRRS